MENVGGKAELEVGIKTSNGLKANPEGFEKKKGQVVDLVRSGLKFELIKACVI